MRPVAALAASLALILPTLAFAEDAVQIVKPYIRIVPGAQTAAAYMVIENHGAQAVDLMSASTPDAKMTMLHHGTVDAKGMASMAEMSGGLPIAAKGQTELKQGGDHIMLMGLQRKLKAGDTVKLTLDFGKGGEVTVDMPVNPVK